MISKILQIFSRSPEQFFLTVCKNNFDNKIPFLQLLSKFFQKSGFVLNHNRVLIFVAAFDCKKLKLLFECRVFSQTKIWSGKWYHYLRKKEIPLRFSFFKKKTFSFLFRKIRKKVAGIENFVQKLTCIGTPIMQGLPYTPHFNQLLITNQYWIQHKNIISTA